MLVHRLVLFVNQHGYGYVAVFSCINPNLHTKFPIWLIPSLWLISLLGIRIRQTDPGALHDLLDFLAVSQ